MHLSNLQLSLKILLGVWSQWIDFSRAQNKKLRLEMLS